MSYGDTAEFQIARQYEWLIVDESGLVMGKLIGGMDYESADRAAIDLGCTLERATRGVYAVGEALPVFHA